MLPADNNGLRDVRYIALRTSDFHDEHLFRGYILILFARLLILQVNDSDSDLVTVPIIIRTCFKLSWRAKLKRVLMRWIIKI